MSSKAEFTPTLLVNRPIDTLWGGGCPREDLLLGMDKKSPRGAGRLVLEGEETPLLGTWLKRN